MNGWLKLTHPNTEQSSIAYLQGDFLTTSEWGRPLQDFINEGYKIVPVVVVESDPSILYLMKADAVLEVQAKLKLMGIELTLNEVVF